MSFVNERAVSAIRKAGLCDGCSTSVTVGSQAVRWAGLTPDGDFNTALYHPECRNAEVALNRLHDTDADEWIGLGEIEREDHAWLTEEHPVRGYTP